MKQFPELIIGTAAPKPSPDGPLPLFPVLPPSEPYPITALGPMLSWAAQAIANKVQVPTAMAAQSVLAAASLATCSLADVAMPYRQSRPLTLYFMTVAASGDRKTTADNEALWPIRKHEANLRENYDHDMKQWRIDRAAWSAEKRKIEGDRKLNFEERKLSIAALGDEPEKPLTPFLVTGDPTVEGLTKNWPNCHAALGVFSAEGGMFTAGHALNEYNRLKTAATLSELWDGKAIKRVRAVDGVTILTGRRLSMHLMIQPDAAGVFLANPALRDQGLLSRVLLVAPESRAGSRPYQEPDPADDVAIKAYGARLLSILETTAALASGKRNELAPPELPISPDAAKLWKDFHSHVESQCGPGDELAPLKDFAAKAAEHAARIAGVITLVGDQHASEISLQTMGGALALAEWYVNEAGRLQKAGRTDPRLLRAAALLEWLEAQPEGQAEFREILRSGPSQTRLKASAEEALGILLEHGRISEVSSRPRLIRVIRELAP